MKIVAVIASCGRGKILQDTINCLKRQVQEIIIVGSSDWVEGEAKGCGHEKHIAHENCLDYVDHKNSPLGVKWQAGLNKARLYFPDAVLICGSDDFIFPSYVEDAKKILDMYSQDKQVDVIGMSLWYVYNAPTKETRPSDGKHPTIKPKDLVGIPWRVAFALQTDGWYLRQDIIWSKPNPMPESVTDRCTKAHEYIFLLSKSQKYYYDAEAIKEPASYNTRERVARAKIDHKSNPNDKISGIRPRKLAPSGSGIKNNDSFDAAMEIMPEHRNKRSVWSVCTEAYPEAHYATFPQDLIKPCILAGAPEQGIVLDPFMGSGTTALVSRDLNRSYVGIELNIKNKILIEKRLSQQRLEL